MLQYCVVKNMAFKKDMQLAEKLAEAVLKKGGTCYFVGGYVRDELMNIDNKDIDIEVHGIMPDELEEILDSLGNRIEIGKSFGIYNLKGSSVDIAMPRKEKAIGAGHRDFEVEIDPFVGTINAAKRRDFTINAIMKNIVTGEIVDHYNGVNDINSRTIRHVDNDSFAEDPLRVLRGAQFAARFEFRIADETVKLCKTMNLTTLSKERVFDEMKKALLKAEMPSVFFERLRQMNCLSFWFAETEQLIGIEQNKNYHREGDVWNHTMMVLDEAAKRRKDADNPLGLMLAALCHDFGKITTTEIVDGKIHAYNHETAGLAIADAFLRRLTSEKKLIKHVLNLVELHMLPNIMAKDESSIKATNRMFDKAVSPLDLLLLASADDAGKISVDEKNSNEAFLNERLKIYKEYISRPQVEGKDLLNAGINPSESYKELLQFAHKLHLAGVPKESALKQTIAYSKKL